MMGLPCTGQWQVALSIGLSVGVVRGVLARRCFGHTLHPPSLRKCGALGVGKKREMN